MAETTQDLLDALKEARSVLASCAEDTAGTPSEKFFRSKVRHCDVVIDKAEKSAALARTALDAAEADRERAVDILRRATTLDHVDGCLFKGDRRMPCQCGFNDKRNQLERDGRDFLRAIDAARLADHEELEGKNEY